MGQFELAKNLSLSLALNLLFFLGGVGIPILGIVLLPLVLYPPLAFGLRYGSRAGTAVPLFSLLILFATGGSDLALSYSVLAAIMIPLLFSFDRAMAVELRVAAGALGGVVVSSVLLWASFGSFSELHQAAWGVLQENFRASLAFYSRIGFSEQETAQLSEHIPGIMRAVLAILPALAFTGFATVILFNLSLLARRFPAYRLCLLSKGDLREWKAAEPVVWLFIGSGFLYLLVPGEAFLKIAALNLFLVSLALYFFQGLSILSYYFHHRKVPFFLRGLSYVLLALEQVMMLAVVGLGLFDLWMDFRGLKKKDLTPTQVS